MTNSTRRLGPYAPLSATYAQDDAVIEAGEAAELLFVRGMAFLATSNSDGYMTKAQVVRHVGAGMRDATRRAARLVEVGLWEQRDGGYLCRSWLKWNRSAEELNQHRKKDRDRKSGRKSSDSPPDPPSGFPKDSRRNPNGTQAESEGSPDGFQTLAHGGTYAGTQAPAPPNHFTTRNDTPVQSTAQHSRAGAGETPAEPRDTHRPAALTSLADNLVAEYVASHTTPVPRERRRKLLEATDSLIEQQFTADQIRAGLVLLWQRPHLGPGLLPNLVHEALAAPAAAAKRPASAAARRQAALAELRRDLDDDTSEQATIFPFVIEGETA